MARFEMIGIIGGKLVIVYFADYDSVLCCHFIFRLIKLKVSHIVYEKSSSLQDVFALINIGQVSSNNALRREVSGLQQIRSFHSINSHCYGRKKDEVEVSL